MNCIFVTSTRQLNEIVPLAKCLKRTKRLREFDLYFHNNSQNYNLEMARKLFDNIPNTKKELIHSNINTGYVSGTLTAIEENFEKLASYDYVITFHADVFPVDEKLFIEQFDRLHKENFDVLFTRYLPIGRDNNGLLSDLFVFSPQKVGKEFFSKDNCDVSLEGTLYKRIINKKIKCLWVERYDESYTNFYKICKLKWLHTHNLSEVDNILNFK